MLGQRTEAAAAQLGLSGLGPAPPGQGLDMENDTPQGGPGQTEDLKDDEKTTAPPGSRTTPPGNPEVDGEALARGMDDLERASGAN